MVITTPAIQENISEACEPRSTTGLGPIFVGEAQMQRLNHVKYPCLSEEEAQSLLNHKMTQLEAGRVRVPAAQERMIPKDVHGGLTARTSGINRKHPHAQTVPKEGAVVEATKGLP